MSDEKKIPVKDCFYRCGDSGTIKRVSLYDYVRPPNRVPDETDNIPVKDWDFTPESRYSVDADFLLWWNGGEIQPMEVSTPKRCAGEIQERFRQSVSRARGMVQQYADCNRWNYFVTLTLDGRKLDRMNLDGFLLKFKKLMENIQRDSGTRPPYVMVPELHRDGVSWHLHGLMNIPPSELVEVTDVYRVRRNGHYQWHMQDGHPIGYDTARKFLIGNGNRLFSWRRYERRFGFCTVETVKSQRATASYCSKMFRYITDTMSSDTSKHKQAWKVLDKGKHLYFASRGLRKYEKIAEEEVADLLLSARASRLYVYQHCEIQFYYTGGCEKCQEGETENLTK